MYKKFKLAFWLGGLASIISVPSARANDTEMNWELSDGFERNTTTGTGTGYMWFLRGISLTFDAATRDGVSSDGHPYVEIRGTDASPNGHCLQLAFRMNPGQSGSFLIEAQDHATKKYVYGFALGEGDEHAIRLWVNKNAGGSGTTLPWKLYVTAYEGSQLELDMRRIEVGKAACATNPGPDPWITVPGGQRWPFATFEGYSGAYTVTTGHF